jgi:hypothetical protein
LAATPVLPPGDVVLVAIDSDCRSNTGARATGGGFDDRMALVGLPSGTPGSEFDPYLDGAFRIEREPSVLPASFSQRSPTELQPSQLPGAISGARPSSAS